MKVGGEYGTVVVVLAAAGAKHWKQQGGEGVEQLSGTG